MPIPSEADVCAFARRVRHDLEQGIPDWWTRQWLQRVSNSPRAFPADWQQSLREAFDRDFRYDRLKFLRLATDEPHWWDDDLDDLYDEVPDLFMGGSGEQAERLKRIIELRCGY